jgi:hypothetical protein
METGDMETATFGCAALVVMSLDSGRPLDGIEKEARSFCQAMDRLNQTVGLSMTMIMYAFIVRDLLGRPIPALGLRGPVQDTATARSVGVASGYVEYLHLGLQAMLLCLQGRHAECIEMSKRGRAAFQETNPCHLFFESVSLLIASRSSRSGILARLHSRRLGRRRCRLFGRWAKKCPANFRGKYALLVAELCTCRGQHVKAVKWYDRAIAWSAQQQMPVDEGLANACLGNCFREMGCPQLAIPFFTKAKEAYQRWGAVTLVAHVDDVIRQIMDSELCSTPPSPAPN